MTSEINYDQGRIKAGADGVAAPGPTKKIGPSIATYYEQLSDFYHFFINQPFYFKVKYDLPILTYQFRLGLKE